MGTPDTKVTLNTINSDSNTGSVSQNHINVVQTILNSKNKSEISRCLECSYYEYQEYGDYQNSVGFVNVFVKPEFFMILQEIEQEDKNVLIKIFNGLKQVSYEIRDVEFAINTEYGLLVPDVELFTVWEQNHFKLFISHLAIDKIRATRLKQALKQYGICGFVAHEDIEPTKEWQLEIEKALHTMAYLVTILIDGFKESDWCTQEVGFALGRNIPIVNIKKGLDPYGFFGKYQAIQGNGKSMSKVACAIFGYIVKNSKTRQKMLSILSNLISSSTNVEMSLKQLKILSKVDDIPKVILQQMADQIQKNIILMKSKDFKGELTKLLDEYDIELQTVNDEIDWSSDDIPF
ncbi:MAG: hypothetical protein ACI8TE_001012 [Francisella sp.]|jgi:hypothetical protein